MSEFIIELKLLALNLIIGWIFIVSIVNLYFWNKDSLNIDNNIYQYTITTDNVDYIEKYDSGNGLMVFINYASSLNNERITKLKWLFVIVIRSVCWL